MLKTFFIIALRNLVKNRKRSLLIGFAVCLSCVILLLSGALANGATYQLADRYRNYLAGDVTVSWANVRDIDLSDAGRLLFSEFDGKKKVENLKAVTAFNAFAAAHEAQIEKIFTPVRVFGMLDTGQFVAFGTIYGVSDAELEFISDKKIFGLSRGESFMDYDDYTVCISDEMAATNHIAIGDWISLDCQTAAGYVNSIEFYVTGTYRNSAPWDNTTIYISEKSARELLQWDPALFSQARIFLREPATAASFATELDAALKGAGGMLVAESAQVAGSFYLTFGDSIKSIFTFFVIFLLAVIALGIRSTVRMNVFERMREFGTLRSMGFAPSSNFFIIVFEIIMLSLAALVTALLFTLVIVFFTSQTGIFTGNGVLTSLLGGEYVYPRLDIGDLVSAVLAIVFFAVLAPAKPALRICIQNITDLLAKTQKNRFAVVHGIRLLIEYIKKSPQRHREHREKNEEMENNKETHERSII